MAWCRGLLSALLLLAAAACAGSEPEPAPAAAGAAGAGAGDGADGGGAGDAQGAGGDGGAPQPSAGGAGAAGDDAGYAGSDSGQCTPGVPRCHGDFGYQMCEQDGTWGRSHSCAGYSANGTSSYCVDVSTPEGEAWGTCVDPACWYWLTRGLDLEATAAGVCTADGRLRRCGPGGSLSTESCAGVCSSVGTLDGRVLGFCAPECEAGERECLGGALYRECTEGRWQPRALACAEGQACNPLASGALSDIRCGGQCELGTTRCSADRAGVETCTSAGEWQLERECRLGRCTPAGAQAECQAECSSGQRACAFDGASSERVCDEQGMWSPEQPCAEGSSCRSGGSLELGCVACVSSGNAFGVADSRCEASALVLCGEDGVWLSPEACEAGSCTELTRGASSVAACSAP